MVAPAAWCETYRYEPEEAASSQIVFEQKTAYDIHLQGRQGARSGLRQWPERQWRTLAPGCGLRDGVIASPVGQPFQRWGRLQLLTAASRRARAEEAAVGYPRCSARSVASRWIRSY